MLGMIHIFFQSQLWNGRNGAWCGDSVSLLAIGSVRKGDIHYHRFAKVRKGLGQGGVFFFGFLALSGFTVYFLSS